MYCYVRVVSKFSFLIHTICRGFLSLGPKSSQWPSIMMSLLFGQTSLPSPLTLWQCMFGNRNQIIRNCIVLLDYYSENWELNVRWTENLIQLSWTDFEQRKVKSPIVSAFNNIVICDYWSPNKQFQILWTLVTGKCLHPVTPPLDSTTNCVMFRSFVQFPFTLSVVAN